MRYTITIEGEHARDVTDELLQECEDLRDSGEYVFSWSHGDPDLQKEGRSPDRPSFYVVYLGENPAQLYGPTKDYGEAQAELAKLPFAESEDVRIAVLWNVPHDDDA